MTAAEAKSLGAFYTSENVSAFLAQWAVRSSRDFVLDPSCGDGVFLRAALAQLVKRKAAPKQVWGVELDSGAARTATHRARGARVIRANFFELNPGKLPFFNAVIGNPPFIRYQNFNGAARDGALRRAREAGVDLNRLSSSWAPFLVHSTSFLVKGGRLAMVVPAELSHARYARQVIRFLTDSFRTVSIILSHERFFPELNEDTMLLLCEGFESPCVRLGVAAVDTIAEVESGDALGAAVDLEGIRSGRIRITHCLVPKRARDLYYSLSAAEGTKRLGEVADVGIGYVTGANDFFHLSDSERIAKQLPSKYLRPAVLGLAEFSGCIFGRRDWARLEQRGDKTYLLELPRNGKLPPKVRQYLAQGETAGISARFKCRVRNPWYVVPHVRVAHALLTYMSTNAPKLVANLAGVVAPNTLHLVTFIRGVRRNAFIAGWNTSLTQLSCELEGHALGGGLLKLEPSEAASVLIPLPSSGGEKSLLRTLNQVIQKEGYQRATLVMDRLILQRRFGLSSSDCDDLQEGISKVRKWRLRK